ncbi:M23 family metallopeptidase [Clavibacter capsici]|uniref:M23 family metallopeptidase n=2 Tax=Clavibacter capsici TaxID=1874630 RepID=A0AAE6XSU0_9MICO|nr:M23 family metallopeptidase [Clavibacter capsici]ALD13725.1 peptidase M23 [Clavibacter capsici]QIS45950.1 M23 family metallopeptidase [Clavibacter capsici]
MNGGGKGVLVLIGTPAALMGMIVFLVLFGFGGDDASACTTQGAASSSTGPRTPVDGYAGDQLDNAAAIMDAAAGLGLSRQAQVLGVMAAMGESSLRNISYGDGARNPDGSIADSIGLFQQQSSWGTVQERLDPPTSAKLFLTRLQTVKGWESLEPTLAIHEVQINKDPYHYRRFQQPAEDVVAQLSGAAAAAPAASPAATGTPDPSATPATAAPAGGCSAGGTVLPLKAPFDQTSGYGPRVSPTAGASSWHPANDYQTRESGSASGRSGYSCGSPVLAAQAGSVTTAGGYTMSIRSAAGYTISYLHMYEPDMEVHVGDTVTAGQEIGKVGSNGPSTGCHLDIRIDARGSTDARVSALPQSQTQGAPVSGYVDPEAFFGVFGVTLCGGECRHATA